MPTWPGSLPQTLTLRHGDDLFSEHDRVRDDMDQGPSFQRPRSTSHVRVLTDCHLVLTDAQMETFRSFVVDELGNGSAAFEWQDPIPGMGLVQVQLGEGVPSAVPVSHELWDVTFTLEVLP